MPNVAEENLALVRRGIEEIINGRRLELIDTFFADDYIEQDGAATRDREGFKAYFREMQTAFPDFQFTIEAQFAADDMVVQRITFRGTHRGAFKGLPPTGKAVRITGIDVFRVQDGKVAAHWGQFDSLSMLQQLGVVPPPGTSPLGILRLVGANIARGIRTQFAGPRPARAC